MTPGDQFRQNYCDIYPATRRRAKALWPRAVAGVSALSCIFFCGVLLAGKFA